LAKLQFKTKNLDKLQERLVLLGFVLKSINKLLHANAVSKNTAWKAVSPCR